MILHITFMMNRYDLIKIDLDKQTDRQVQLYCYYSVWIQGNEIQIEYQLKNEHIVPL